MSIWLILLVRTAIAHQPKRMLVKLLITAIGEWKCSHRFHTFLTNCLYTGLTNRRCPVGNLTGHSVTQVIEHVPTQNKILPLFVDLYYCSGNMLGEKQMFLLDTIVNEIEL